MDCRHRFHDRFDHPKPVPPTSASTSACFCSRLCPEQLIGLTELEGSEKLQIEQMCTGNDLSNSKAEAPLDERHVWHEV